MKYTLLILAMLPSFLLAAENPLLGPETILDTYMNRCGKPAQVDIELPPIKSLHNAIISCMSKHPEDPAALVMRGNAKIALGKIDANQALEDSAIEDYCKSAESGFVVGQLRCGQYLGTQGKKEKSEYWLYKAAENGSLSALGLLSSVWLHPELTNEKTAENGLKARYAICHGTFIADDGFGEVSFSFYPNDRLELEKKFHPTKYEVKQCLTEANEDFSFILKKKKNLREDAAKFAQSVIEQVNAQVNKFQSLQSFVIR